MWKIWQLIMTLLSDSRGEDTPSGAPAGTAPVLNPPAPAGTGDAQGDIDDQGDGGPAGDGSAAPIFGEFGSDPNEAAPKLFETFTKVKGEFDSLRTKSGLTEKNLASLRQAMQAHGIQAVQGEDGQIRLEVVKQPGQERKTRFTDQHKSLFDEKVLEGIRNLVQDIFDEQYEGREKTTQEKQQQMQKFISEKQDVEGLMLGYFPQLKSDDPNFNQAFYDRATAIWHEQYSGHPLKQLSAALRAAQELKIIPQMIAQAKVEGIKKGKEDKRILAPVSGGGAGAGGTGLRKLSREEYLALPQDEKVKYDQWRLDHPDAK
jgi:hypothetical protein